jgi:tRNA pseudouridine55 synthase
MTGSPHITERNPAVTGHADGILNINKPAGLTSHDVVARVRRLTGQRRVGHAGTLDPMATGVLLVCLGQATRVAEYLMRGQKVYRATARLGIATDTYDAEGSITQVVPSPEVSRAQVEQVLAAFLGLVQQAPPPYSAVRQGGQPLYKLARRGIAVQAVPRPICIAAIDLVDWQPPSLTVEIRCSPGTYVRSLIHDMGQALGSGAHVTALTRLASGSWRLEESVPLEQLQAAAAGHGDWTGWLYPIDAALQNFIRVCLSHEAVAQVVQGRPIRIETAPETLLIRAYAPDDTLVALMQPIEDRPGWWRPHKVFRS